MFYILNIFCMVYTETTNTSYWKRIWKSITWMLLWLILIFVSIYLLWWNEWRTIKTTQWLTEWERITVSGSTSPVDNLLDWKLIYINWKADTKEVLNDNEFFINLNAIKLNRKVEMYQWEENKKTTSNDNLWGSETTTTTYTYKKIWSEEKIDSSPFKELWHDNFMDFKYNSESFVSNNVLVWDLKLSPTFIKKIDKEETILIDENIVNKVKISRNIDNIKLENNSIYIWIWSLSTPQIWDLKITFSAVYPSEISAIWQQQWNTLVPYKTKTDTLINLLKYGNISLQEMYIQANNENKFIAWILRGVWILLMFIWFNMIFWIIIIIFKIIPFLSHLVSIWTWLVSFILTLILWWWTIIIAWFYVRPLISIILLSIIWWIIYALYKYKNKKEVSNI